LFLAVVGLGSLLGAGACNKEGDKKAADNKAVEKDTKDTAAPGGDKKPDQAAAGSASMTAAPTTAPGAAPPAEMAAKASSAVATGGNADDLSLLPVDSEMVVGVNWKQLSNSALWKEFVAPKLAADANFNAGIGKFKALCSFDPMDAMTTISVGLKNLGNKSPDGAIVIHGFDRAKSMACFDKDGKAEAEKDGTKVTIEDNVVLLQKAGDPSLGFTFVNDTTALVVLGAKADSTAGVKEVAGGKTALGTSPNFVEIYNKVNTADSVWMIANGNSKLFNEMSSKIPNAKLKAMFGSVNVTDGVTADVRVRVDSPENAKMLAEMGKQQAGAAAMFVDKIDIVADGSDIHAQLGITNAKLHTLMQFAAMGKAQHAGGGGGGLFGPK
jgi:hypothetical protein